MKIETDDNTSIAFTLSVLLVGVFCLVGYGCNQVEQTQREYINSGMNQVQKEGSTTTYWTHSEAP